MMQLICNNTVLDLYDNASLQFKHTNPLFAFDKMTCERTTQFKLPCTPTNDRVLSLARIPAYAGEGMRRLFNAQLQMGTLVMDGYLYVSDYDGKDYTAIFVMGELLGLKRIRDLGKINESDVMYQYWNTVQKLQIGDLGEYPYSHYTDLWENVRYRHDSLISTKPSIGVAALLHAFGIYDRDGMIDNMKLRLIVTDPKYVQEKELTYVIDFHNISNGGYRPAGGGDLYNVSYLTVAGQSGQYFLEDEIFDSSDVRAIVQYTDSGTNYRAYVVQKKTRAAKTVISFPTNTPDDYFIGYFTDQPAINSNLSDFTFLGNYSFDAGGNVTGSPLKNRSVEIPAETPFCIIKKEWYTSDGWKILTPTFDLTYCWLNLSDFKPEELGIWRLVDNLPNCTCVDLLKAIAALSGKLLNYTEEDGVSFEDALSTDPPIEIDSRVIKVSKVERTFSDYAQKNYVLFTFDEAQNVYDIQGVLYAIDNKNLKEENTLLTLIAGNGETYTDDANLVYINAGMKVNVLAKYETTYPYYLCRSAIEASSLINTLCDKSTQVIADVRMSSLEYFSITPKTRILYRGTLYAWTERTFKENTAQFTLARIS